MSGSSPAVTVTVCGSFQVEVVNSSLFDWLSSIRSLSAGAEIATITMPAGSLPSLTV